MSAHAAALGPPPGAPRGDEDGRWLTAAPLMGRGGFIVFGGLLDAATLAALQAEARAAYSSASRCPRSARGRTGARRSSMSASTRRS